MSDYIGPGDVVEYVDRSCGVFSLGDREIVLAVETNPGYHCSWGCKKSFGIKLRRTSPAGWDTWCAMHWRKIGGSQDDTVEAFREDLNLVKEPEFAQS